jgi:hypothetical protein
MKSTFNTDSFKSALTGGGARGNQFVVQLNFPAFAMDGTAVNQSQFLVTAAELPGQKIGKTGTMYRGREIKLAGDRSFSPWTITIINDASMSIRRSLEKWMNGINGLSDNSGYLSPFDYQVDLHVTQLDRNNNELKSYMLYDCMPLDLGAIQLRFDDNDSVEEYQVTFEMQDFETDFPGVSGQAR